MRKLKAVLIGCGNVGYRLQRFDPGFTSTHLEAYRKNSSVKLSAVCDTDISLAVEAGKEVQAEPFSDYREMLAKHRPDIVSICTPDQTHKEVLFDVVDLGGVKGIWCEKPIATTLRDGRDMVSICEKKGIKLLVNFPRRYDLFYQGLKDNMKDYLGEVQGVNCLYSGGITTIGSHLSDLLIFLFGRCAKVWAYSKDSGHGGVLVFCNGLHVTLTPCSNDHFAIMEMDIIGEKGRIDTINRSFIRYDYRFYEREKDDLVGVSFLGNRSSDLLRRDLPRDFFDRALQDLLGSVESGMGLVSSGDSALGSLELISGIVRSAAIGETVDLPLTLDDIKIPKADGDISKWKN